MSKIVVLNSGGFDSVVLANDVFYHSDQNTEIHNLFFNYGQLNVNSERRCSQQCADKLGLIFKEITIPHFDWSDSVLSGGTNQSQYIPLRNLVLISYALSYAEAIGAKQIFCAFIDPECVYYNDTSPLFVEKLNELSFIFGIEIVAPFIHSYKTGLLKSLARKYGVYEKDVHSCNYSDIPCGECDDCKSLNEIFSSMELGVSDDILIDNHFEVTDDFITSIQDSKITTAKLYINNSCQFSCSHCFIGKHKLFSKPLSTEEWCYVIKDLVNAGITNIDFFGKEPLFDDKIFTLLDVCKSLGVTYSLITNGVNVKSYIDELEKYKPKVALSVETLDNNLKHRNTGRHILDTINLLLEREIPVSISIDLNYGNYKKIPSIIQTLYKVGVKEFYVKPIRPFGENESDLMKSLIHPKHIYSTMDKLQKLSKELSVGVTISFASMDLYRLLEYDRDKFNSMIGVAIINRSDYVGNLFIDTELYCHRFKNIISITPDGYVLGCASEYCTDYSWCRNVRNFSISDCIDLGKKDLGNSDYECAGCYFCSSYKSSYKTFSKLLKTLE